MKEGCGAGGVCLRQEALQENYVSQRVAERIMVKGSERQQEPDGIGLHRDYKVWISSCVKWRSTFLWKVREQSGKIFFKEGVLDLVCRLACEC